MTLHGYNFGVLGKQEVMLGRKRVDTFWWISHEEMQFLLPPGSGSDESLVIVSGGERSEASSFS